MGFTHLLFRDGFTHLLFRDGFGIIFLSPMAKNFIQIFIYAWSGFCETKLKKIVLYSLIKVLHSLIKVMTEKSLTRCYILLGHTFLPSGICLCILAKPSCWIRIHLDQNWSPSGTHNTMWKWIRLETEPHRHNLCCSHPGRMEVWGSICASIRVCIYIYAQRHF